MAQGRYKTETLAVLPSCKCQRFKMQTRCIIMRKTLKNYASSDFVSIAWQLENVGRTWNVKSRK